MEHLEVPPWIAVQFHHLLEKLGISMSERDAIALTMVLTLVVAVSLLFGLYRRRYRIVPTPVQQVLEGYYEFIRGLCVDMIGEERGEKYVPVIGTVGLFVLLSNLMGLVPGLVAPTSNLNVTVGAAVFVFLYYHLEGIRTHGLIGYIRHFMGPNPWLAWLFLPVEIVSHLARVLSLSVRLFGNIFGKDTLILVLFMVIFPIIVPLPLMVLAVIVSFVQALVFVMLAVTYIAGAVAGEEHH
ncbi:MAG: F0F1 ATP synthase subunit A [Acidobacteria bacterium]|nr:F0F1 ATP synthase subunit A [Acidobacteriota bacterium]MDW7984274.1 F0F1 ATP synthase subunit A [Acidobacteriota bacterium]